MMRDVIESLYDYLIDNWPELLWIVVAAYVASYLAGRRARTRWRRREFLDRLNVSLTSIEKGVLKIRTILEMDCTEILLNPSASKALGELASKTTLDDPVIPIPKADAWYYLNAVLNEVSERFALGHLRRDASMDVHTETYLMCLTHEQAGQVRTRKIRAMMVRKSLLLNLPAETPSFERPTHSTRWETLQKMAEKYRSRPDQFVEMEISL
ncbi:hypothetical protein [Crateriforma conspicua]|nr:hypothetical protein [Crateriforma conspicua]